MAFIYRAVLMPATEFQQIPTIDLQNLVESFLKKFENRFGIRSMKYSMHLLLHVVLCRTKYDLTQKSTFCTESFYSIIRRFITPGTRSITKQVLERVFSYIQLRRNTHKCQNSLAFSTRAKKSSKIDNSLIAITAKKIWSNCKH